MRAAFINMASFATAPGAFNNPHGIKKFNSVSPKTNCTPYQMQTFYNFFTRGAVRVWAERDESAPQAGGASELCD